MEETHNWPDLAIGLFERLTGRGAEITYEFDNMTVGVPASTNDGAPQAKWSLNGALKIRTSSDKNAGAEG